MISKSKLITDWETKGVKASISLEHKLECYKIGLLRTLVIISLPLFFSSGQNEAINYKDLSTNKHKYVNLKNNKLCRKYFVTSIVFCLVHEVTESFLVKKICVGKLFVLTWHFLSNLFFSFITFYLFIYLLSHSLT